MLMQVLIAAALPPAAVAVGNVLEEALEHILVVLEEAPVGIHTLEQVQHDEEMQIHHCVFDARQAVVVESELHGAESKAQTTEQMLVQGTKAVHGCSSL